MNRQILASFLVIGLVAAVAGSTTMALFSDTETSEDNTFAAGSVDLKIDWEESYNGEVIEQQELTDNPGPIFQFSDIKPGDEGEATVSFHVFDNPAYVSMTLNQTSNRDNSCTEPEIEAEPNCVSEGTGEGTGELGQHMQFLVWDDDGDNVHQSGEEVFFNGTADELAAEGMSVDLDSDPTTETRDAYVNSTTHYVGVQWSLPLSVGNEVQTDSKAFDINFHAVQARNVNGSNIPVPQEEPPVVTPPGNETNDTNGNVTPPGNQTNVTLPSSNVTFAAAPVFAGCSSVVAYPANATNATVFHPVVDDNGTIATMNQTIGSADEVFQPNHPVFGSGMTDVLGYKFEFDKTVGLLGNTSYRNPNYDMQQQSCGNAAGVVDGVPFNWTNVSIG